MIQRLALILLAACLVACETGSEFLFTTGAKGTEIQAERLVALIYGQGNKALPYGNIDVDRAVGRMQARWPQLKAELDRGAAGLTEDGEVAIRVPGDSARSLRKLVKDENRDRQLLYRMTGVLIGHGATEAQLSWLEYTEDVFAREWIARAPGNWWVRDAAQEWQIKEKLQK